MPGFLEVEFSTLCVLSPNKYDLYITTLSGSFLQVCVSRKKDNKRETYSVVLSPEKVKELYFFIKQNYDL